MLGSDTFMEKGGPFNYSCIPFNSILKSSPPTEHVMGVVSLVTGFSFLIFNCTQGSSTSCGDRVNKYIQQEGVWPYSVGTGAKDVVHSPFN